MSSGETTASASDCSSSRSQTINWPSSTIGYSGDSEKLASARGNRSSNSFAAGEPSSAARTEFRAFA